jgi:hypothetical protein
MFPVIHTPNFSFEFLSLDAILSTQLREVPAALLRIGRLELDDEIGLQLGPLTIWFTPETLQ